MFEFDLQRFDEDTADTAAQETSTEAAKSETAEEKPIPEELNGLPEDIARETLNEWEAMQKFSEEPEQEQQAEQPAQEPKPQTEESVPYARFKEKVDEANQLKALLAQYQQQAQVRQQQQQQAPPPQQPQQGLRITPEVAQKINAAIDAEAKALTGLTQEDVEKLDFVDDDDAKAVQWEQAKALARNRVFHALRNELASRQQQAQQFLTTHQAAVQSYNDFVQKEFATVPNIQEIQNFAANEFFEQLPPNEKVVLADSYMRVERKTASPAEMLVVQKYYEQAKAAFNARANAAKQPPQTPAQRAQQAQNLPRADQLKGTSSKTAVKGTSSLSHKALTNSSSLSALFLIP